MIQQSILETSEMQSKIDGLKMEFAESSAPLRRQLESEKFKGKEWVQKIK